MLRANRWRRERSSIGSFRRPLHRSEPGIDTETLLSIHRGFAWVTVVGNGLAGVYALLAWRLPGLRGRSVWVALAAAQVAIVIEVVMGVMLVSGEAMEAPPFHTFYGFVAVITIGLAYSYRQAMRGRLEMFYGLVGLFLMGLAIRAMVV